MNFWLFLTIILASYLACAVLLYFWLGVSGVAGALLVTFILWRLVKGESIGL